MGIRREEGENGVFDDQKKARSSGVFDTKRHSNVKSKAEYRRIHRYYKSARKWRLERERRKRVLQLHEEGLSYADIARRLGVSVRTVKRDMAKIRPYYERKVRRERAAKFDAEFEGKSLIERLRIGDRMLVDYFKLAEPREYFRHQLTVTIDLDAVAAGEPALKCTPNPHFSIKFPFRIKFELATKGKKIPAGWLEISAERKSPSGSFGY